MRHFTGSALVALVFLAGCGEDERGVAPEGQPERPLRIDGLSGLALLPLDVAMERLPSVVEVDDVVRFRIVATLRRPSPRSTVAIRLQNPPPGCTCAPVSVSGASAAADGRWVVASPSVGAVRLQFRIATSAGTFLKTFDVRVEGIGEGNGLLVGDVTGDGLLDVVALATEAGARDEGALFVFAGATHPATTPTAVLVDSAPHADDRMGSPLAPLVQLFDVTGDSILDVVAAVPRSDRGAVDAGEILVWVGGPGLVGTSPPTWILLAKTPRKGALLGWPEVPIEGELRGGGKLSIMFADVTGDHAVDVIAVAPNDDGDVEDAGAVYVFAGGSALVSRPPGSVVSELARLALKPGSGAARLGSGGKPIRLGDVTGDGVLDLLVSTEVTALESLYLFQGGPTLLGAITPKATLRVNQTTPVAPSLFTAAPRFAELGDVDGDGVLDVVACASDAQVDGVTFQGLGCLWRGSATLEGNPPPDAVLRVGAAPGDQQGQSGLRLHKLTARGTLDVIIAAPGFSDGVGEVRLWRGGSSILGTPAPVFLRSPISSPGGRLGSTGGRLTEPFAFGDVTGDGADDLVVIASKASYGGASGVGQVLVFRGGADLFLAPGTVAPALSTLRGEAITGLARGDTTAHGAQLEDLDGDGSLDVVATSLSGGGSARLVECWRGGPSAFAVVSAPNRVLALPLTLAFGELVTLCDLTGDHRLDVAVRVGPESATSPAVEIFGGATLFTTLAEHVVLSTGDGETPAQRSGLNALFVPLLAGDVTGNERMDVVGADSLSNASGAASGCVYLWSPTRFGAQNPLGLPALRVRGHATASRNFPTLVRGGQGVVLADLTGDGVLEVLVGDPKAGGLEGEIGWVRGQPSLPTSAATGFSGTLFAGTGADGLTR